MSLIQPPQPVPRPLLRPYLCEACDVYGRGDSCWNCGSEDLAWGRSPVTVNAVTVYAGVTYSPERPSSSLTSWSTQTDDVPG